VTWRTRAGALGELWHSWGLEGGRAPLRSAVIGTEGTLHFDPSGRLALLSSGRSRTSRPVVPWRALWSGGDLTGTEEMWRQFLDAVRSGSVVPHTLSEATADLGVVDAAYRSMGSRTAQALDPALFSA
jgi:predicted dehydrogenase